MNEFLAGPSGAGQLIGNSSEALWPSCATGRSRDTTNLLNDSSSRASWNDQPQVFAVANAEAMVESMTPACVAAGEVPFCCRVVARDAQQLRLRDCLPLPRLQLQQQPSAAYLHRRNTQHATHACVTRIHAHASSSSLPARRPSSALDHDERPCMSRRVGGG